MIAADESVTDLLQRVQAEYLEIPGLHLTRAQAQRLWSIDPHVCDAMLGALVAARFLRRTHRDAYVLAGSSR